MLLLPACPAEAACCILEHELHGVAVYSLIRTEEYRVLRWNGIPIYGVSDLYF